MAQSQELKYVCELLDSALEIMTAADKLTKITDLDLSAVYLCARGRVDDAFKIVQEEVHRTAGEERAAFPAPPVGDGSGTTSLPDPQ